MIENNNRYRNAMRHYHLLGAIAFCLLVLTVSSANIFYPDFFELRTLVWAVSLGICLAASILATFIEGRSSNIILGAIVLVVASGSSVITVTYGSRLSSITDVFPLFAFFLVLSSGYRWLVGRYLRLPLEKKALQTAQ